MEMEFKDRTFVNFFNCPYCGFDESYIMDINGSGQEINLTCGKREDCGKEYVTKGEIIFNVKEVK